MISEGGLFNAYANPFFLFYLMTYLSLQVSADESNMNEVTGENEKKLFITLLDEYKVYIPNGTEFGSKDPGWFRIIFAIKRDHWIEFCRRFENFVKNRQLLKTKK